VGQHQGHGLTELAGGLRARLLRDSLILGLKNAMTVLGWFNPGRSHLPLTFYYVEQEWDVEIRPNAVGLFVTYVESFETEVGSNLHTDRLSMRLELYVESSAVAAQAKGDLVAILQGRSGWTQASFPIYDLRQATPPVLGYGQIGTETIQTSHVTGSVKRSFDMQCHIVSFEVQDTYMGGVP